MFGQFGHFYSYGGKNLEEKYPLERYAKEAKRLIQVMDNRLASSKYLGGDTYSIADICTFPWFWALTAAYNAQEMLGLDSFVNVQKWYQECIARPAFKKAKDRMAK
jgi:GST-like protein